MARELIAITPEAAQLVQEICEEIVSDLRPPHDEEQMKPETLNDHLGNLRASADEYAKALHGVTAENFASNADDMVRALAEHMRAIVKLACRA